MKPRPPKKWLSLAAVAELMRIEHPDPAYRRQVAWRAVRGLERRDGTAYMRRFGEGKGKLWVSPTTIEQLDPWNPATLGKMREDIDENREETRAIRRQVNGHGSRILTLEKFKRATEAYMKVLGE